MDDDYGVERADNGNVEIRLGHIAPIAKKAGCEVLFRVTNVKLKFPQGITIAPTTNDNHERLN